MEWSVENLSNCVTRVSITSLRYVHLQSVMKLLLLKK